MRSEHGTCFFVIRFHPQAPFLFQHISNANHGLGIDRYLFSGMRALRAHIGIG